MSAARTVSGSDCELEARFRRQHESELVHVDVVGDQVDRLARDGAVPVSRRLAHDDMPADELRPFARHVEREQLVGGDENFRRHASNVRREGGHGEPRSRERVTRASPAMSTPSRPAPYTPAASRTVLDGCNARRNSLTFMQSTPRSLIRSDPRYSNNPVAVE